VIVQLANDAPVIVVWQYAPHPCGGYYIEDAKVLGLNWPARPAGRPA
jgi:hypothetical protein